MKNIKSWKIMIIFLMVSMAIVLTGCPVPIADSSEILPAKVTIFDLVEGSELASGSSVITASSAVTLIETGKEFKMIYAQDKDSIEFPIDNDSTSYELKDRFWMSETEVTNEIFAAVYQWAYNKGKFDTEDNTAHNYLDSTTVKYGNQVLIDINNSNCRVEYKDGEFTVESNYEKYPVVCVSWYGAVIFSNWLTEMRDGNEENVAYTWIDANGDGTWQDTETIPTLERKGSYRLPSKEEWEYAARYRGSDSTNTVSGYADPYFTKGDSASGSEEAVGNNAGTQKVTWYGNDDGNLHEVGQKIANTLGLYDMSGNSNEWTFSSGSDGSRIIRGGSFGDYYLMVKIGQSTYLEDDPANTIYATNATHGFRVVRNGN